MGVIREVIFGKVDLDTMLTALVLGLNPVESLFRHCAGSASSAALADTSVVAIEVGGSGRIAENNFDHHASSTSLAASGVDLSSAAQALERMARLVRYVDELDRGLRRAEESSAGGFPTLSQLISGMLLVVKKPEQRMEKGMDILRAVLQAGIDPYACMEPILDAVPHARWYARAKREHDSNFESVLAEAVWHTTKTGRRLAVVETAWIGAPGALYGAGAEIVVALNPAMEITESKTIRKFTVAGNGISVLSAIQALGECEDGWGGPTHGTIGGSPRERSSELALDEVVQLVIDTL